MSIEVPQYTIQAKVEKNSTIKKGLLPVVAIVGLLVGYFSSDLYANKMMKTLQQRNEVLEVANTENQNTIEELTTKVTQLKTEQKVKQEAIVQIQNDYKGVLDDLNFLKSEIDFYERLLSPSAENKGLRVFEALASSVSENDYHLKLVLVQKIERAKEISGQYEISLVGQQDNTSKTIKISDKNSAGYQFKYFQNISLNFSVPEGFKAEQLVVKLFPKRKKAKTVIHTVEWHSITE